MVSICTEAHGPGCKEARSLRCDSSEVSRQVPGPGPMARLGTEINGLADSKIPDRDSRTHVQPSGGRAGEFRGFRVSSIAGPESRSRGPALLGGTAIRYGCKPLMATPWLHVAVELSLSNANRRQSGCRCCLVAPLMVTSEYLTNAKNPASSPFYRELPD